MKTSESEKKLFTFKQPVNPSQSIITFLKTFKAGVGEATFAAQLGKFDVVDIAYAIYSLIQET